MLRAINLSKDFGGHQVLRDVSFVLSKGAKVGLVGLNGSGKSTLFKILMGDLEPDSGRVERSPHATVGWVPQHRNEHGSTPVSHLVLLSQLMELPPWKIEMVFHEAGLTNISLDRDAGSLSGGEQTRLLIAAAFHCGSHILLLDEPTNNLDLDGIAWLERLVCESPAACLIASHDRRFLDNVTSRTLELDALTGTTSEYGGNYSWYRKAKADEQDRQWRQYQAQQRRIKQLQADIADTKQTAMKTENSTVHDFYRGRAKKVAAKAKARESRLTRMLSDAQRVDKPRSNHTMRLALDGGKLYNRLLFEARNAEVRCEERVVLRDLNQTISGNARIGIVGRNGAGKSTLIKLIMGLIEPQTGEVRRNADLRIGYMSQQQSDWSKETNVIEHFVDSLTHEDGKNRALSEPSAARTFLHRFLFCGDDVFKPVNRLSPGERAKLLFACFMAGNPDLLVLDEPTNHMDIQSLECLEQALGLYSGALVVVSHDREFLAQIELEELWTIDGSGRLVISPPPQPG